MVAVVEKPFANAGDPLSVAIIPNILACLRLLPSDEGRWPRECEDGRVPTTFLTAHATESVDELVNTHKAIVVAVHNKPVANVTE